MARMKIEFLAHYKAQARPHAARPADRQPAALRAVGARAWRRLPTCAVGLRASAALGFAPQRALPQLARDTFLADDRRRRDATATSCCSSTPSTATSSRRTRTPRCACCEAAGYRVHRRPRRRAALCCGRTFLAAGHGRRGKREARRHARGARAVRRSAACRSSGSSRRACSPCATSSPSLGLGDDAQRVAKRACCSRSSSRARRRGPAQARAQAAAAAEALLHGHCHQKAFDAMRAVQKVLGAGARPEGQTDRDRAAAAWPAASATRPSTTTSRCDGRAVAAARRAQGAADTLIVADGTSCRHQIADGAQREARPRRARARDGASARVEAS